MTRTLTVAAALSLLALPALAGSVERFEMIMDVNRTALETPAGAEQELIRIREDVHERCVAEHADWPFSTRLAVSFCEERTLKNAIKAIDAPNLTAAYEAASAN